MDKKLEAIVKFYKRLSKKEKGVFLNGASQRLGCSRKTVFRKMTDPEKFALKSLIQIEIEELSNFLINHFNHANTDHNPTGLAAGNGSFPDLEG